MVYIKLFWEIYYFTYLGLYFYSLYIVIAFANGIPDLSLSEWLEYITSIFGIAALFGLVKRRPIYHQWPWKVIFVLVIVNEALYGVYYTFNAASDANESPVFAFVYMCILLPYWVGLGIYAFSKSIWQEK